MCPPTPPTDRTAAADLCLACQSGRGSRQTEDAIVVEYFPYSAIPIITLVNTLTTN